MVGGEGLGQPMLAPRAVCKGLRRTPIFAEAWDSYQEDGVYIVICKTQDYNGVFAMREEPSGGRLCFIPHRCGSDETLGPTSVTTIARLSCSPQSDLLAPGLEFSDPPLFRLARRNDPF